MPSSGEMRVPPFPVRSPHPLDQDSLPIMYIEIAPIFQMQTLRYIETRAVQEA